MAGQDPIKVNVNINFKNTNKDITKNDPIQIAVTNANADNQFKDIKVDTKISNNGNWNIQYTNNGIYKATWNGTSSPTELKFKFHILGDDSTIKTPTEVAHVVTIKYDDKTIPSNPTPLYKKEYVPFEDKVNKYELIKGFHLAETTVKNESQYQNIGAADLDIIKAIDPNAKIVNGKVESNSDQTIYQWGIYFNYSKVLNKDWNELVDPNFQAKFGGSQKLLPTSIKAFEVPSDLLQTKNGIRPGIGDKLPDTEKYASFIANWKKDNKGQTPTIYNYITYRDNKLQRTQFGQTLTKDSENNTIIFGKKEGNNTFNADHSLGNNVNDNTAYFIQVDTLSTVSAGANPVLITSNFEGSGKTQEKHTEPFYYGIASSDSEQEDIKTITQKATVIEKVNYYYANGPHTSNPVVDKRNTSITVTYTRTGTYDATKDPNATLIN